MALSIENFKIEIIPTVDFVVKQLLGVQVRSYITCHFLNALLQWENPITSVTIRNPFIEKDFEEDKLSILDVLAVDSLNHRFNVEIQRFQQTWLAGRLTYYGSSLLVEQLGEGDSYIGLRPVISVCLLNGQLLTEAGSYHHEFRLRTQDGLELSNLMQIHLLELPKYQPTSDNGAIEDPIEQWVYFFKYAEGMMSHDLLQRLADPLFEELVEILKMIQRTPEQRLLYELRVRAERDYITGLEAARREGEASGEARGKAEGVALGRLRALQQVLGLPEITDTEFETLDSIAIERIISELQDRIRNRS